MLTLASFGLTAQEKTVLRSILVAKSSGLNSPWTFFLDESEAPQNPSAFLCPVHRPEGEAAMLRLGGLSVPIVVTPPGSASPSSGFHLKTPFRPQDIADTLNNVAASLKMAIATNPEADDSAQPSPARWQAASNQGEPGEVRLDLLAAFPGGASKVSGLALAIFGAFQKADKKQFYKIKRVGGPIEREIWCWPDLDLYWSDLPEDVACYDPDGEYEVWLCNDKREALNLKADRVRAAHNFLWRAGWRSKKTAELLPWFPADHKISLASWPDMPKDMRTPSIIRALLRLVRSEISLAEMIVEMKMPRKDACCFVNSLIMCGKAVSVPAATRQKKPAMTLEPDEAVFLRSLAIVVFERLEDALSEGE